MTTDLATMPGVSPGPTPDRALLQSSRGTVRLCSETAHGALLRVRSLHSRLRPLPL